MTRKNFFANEAITWEFIPPAAPHWGGLWEACAKSMKHHLVRVLGKFTPTWEEMLTCLCHIEACLNSRPLTALREDILDMPALTPGHFLIGDALKSLPEKSCLDLNENLLTR